MDIHDRLQAYTQQLLALGGATLAAHRDGDTLPPELAAAAGELLALGDSLPDVARFSRIAPAQERDSGEARYETPGDEAPLIILSEPSAAGDDLPPLFADAVAIGDDDLSAVPAAEAGDVLVLDVDQEPGGGPAELGSPWQQLPPLVVDAGALHEAAPAASDSVEWPAVGPGALAEAAPPSEALGYCNNCGKELRPGKRFCHHCGTPVADPPIQTATAAPVSSPIAPAASSPSPLPLSEWPTYAGSPWGDSSPGDTPPEDSLPGDAPWSDTPWPDTPRYEEPRHSETPAAPPADPRFCNNCGMNVPAGIVICPECGSRDIG